MVVGTISANNVSNTSGGGSAGPVSVITNIYDAALVTTSTDGLSMTNTGTGSNGANSLIASAQVQSNTIITGSTQDADAWTALYAEDRRGE